MSGAQAARRGTAALVLGGAAALLVACGSSSGVLIGAAEAGPLQGDVEAVDQAAESGNCSSTESALLKTDQDFAALPATVDRELRNRLRLGIENLHKVAREACAQPASKTTTTATTTTSTTKTNTTPTTPTNTITTPTTPTTIPPTEATETPGAGGGTPAPGEGQGKAPGEGAGGAGAEEGTPPVSGEPAR